MKRCPTCHTALPEYPDAGWTCACGRCVAVYMGSGGIVGTIGEAPTKPAVRWPVPKQETTR